MLFENCTTRTKQGDLGEARAIYEYTKLGYGVSRTIFDSEYYDLIIDDGVSLKRVQVRTSTQQNDSGAYMVSLVTGGGNTKQTTRRLFDKNDYDILFVLTSSDRCWSIPVETINNTTTINVGGKGYGTKYHEYELNVVRPYIPPTTSSKQLNALTEEMILNAAKDCYSLTDMFKILNIRRSVTGVNLINRVLKEHGIKLHHSNSCSIEEDISACKHFSKEELQELVLQMPMTEVGKRYGLSDNAIRRWVKKWQIQIPPHGYFLSKEFGVTKINLKK